MTTKKYDAAVIIGRFQPIHNGHVSLIEYAKTISDKVSILVGSCNQPRTIKNPYTFEEREYAINQSCDVDDVIPLNDYLYEDNKWVSQVQSKITELKEKYGCESICIVGHDKDDSTYYLSMFPDCDVVDPGKYVQNGSHEINATQIRKVLFEKMLSFIEGAMPSPAFKYLISDFCETDEYHQLVKEYQFIEKYKKQWDSAPYPPTFMTVDCVLVQGGHVLLVKRKSEPGKGLWALPGGFVNQDETLEQAMLRELKEETKIKIPKPILRANITHRQQFDHPKRSLRGRTFTEAFLVEVPIDPKMKLAKIKGSDDAEEARWFKISDINNMSEVLFEDHYSIISMMVSRSK